MNIFSKIDPKYKELHILDGTQNLKKYNMKEKLCFVQFTHPGKERKPLKGDLFVKWNEGQHRRKFLLANGDFVRDNNLMKDTPLLFWGEWEPRSEIVKVLDKQNSSRLPKYFQKPVLTDYPIPRQNTDPYVFGEPFYYFCCKQSKKIKRTKSRRPTQLAKLKRGSVILFGSTINQDSHNPYFALDTVFVVDSYIDYTPQNYESKLKGRVSDDFFEISVKSAYQNTGDIESKYRGCVETFDNELPRGTCNAVSSKSEKGNPELELRCYFGATFSNPCNGMYSFVPCKQYEENSVGFERVKSDLDLDFITNNLSAAPRLNSTDDINVNVDRWNKIRKMVKDQGLLEGVRFEFHKMQD